jgi:hypothetical protein
MANAAVDLPSLALDAFRLAVDEDERNILGFVDIDPWTSSMIPMIPRVPPRGQPY